MINEFQMAYIEDVVKRGGIRALIREKEKVELYIERMQSEPYADLKDRREYLAAIKDAIKELGG